MASPARAKRKRNRRQKRRDAKRQWTRNGRVVYEIYMRSDAWNAIRKKALRRAGYMCNRCKARSVPLQVHHKTYARLGREDMQDLEVLCVPCHHEEHHGRTEPVDELFEEYKAICQ